MGLFSWLLGEVEAEQGSIMLPTSATTNQFVAQVLDSMAERRLRYPVRNPQIKGLMKPPAPPAPPKAGSR